MTRSTNFGSVSSEEITDTRRELRFASQAAVLEQVDMLGVADTVEVLRREIRGIITLIDVHSATVKIPAFQFKRTAEGKLVVIPGVWKLNQVKTGNGHLPLYNNDWLLLDWWFSQMKLDTREPDTTAFRPIDVVLDPEMVTKIIDWFKELANEPGFG